MTETIKKRETPFVCEYPCLRVDARKLILQTKGKVKSWHGFAIMIVIFIIGYLVGKV